ncbi:SDR family NAD(P)-dependent oxidoreductase [Cryptosporangium aurantiacum]|uniref:NAD(P)-dependent dehydrogenase, short-chain alcohol dehydrogenase family n=1 Tax=Cryptosporangium aurantiacum TaxID=134849 RepID=A0A1M7KKG1_9ACTN|nr:SDR family NAD(P)-dependent oxidoreductase [Cryptosporangium aurantiacum]SHM65895.1 NAD(P)-dependent dehydrogenase, short-chain alcohol dehydrogenase family [Cryptosporangium aurantiacum]
MATEKSLAGAVAVVTGASRGIGKGIALALGERGATVYVTGRTVAPGTHSLPGTVGETAAEVDRRGGTGVAVQVDHGDDEQVAALFARVFRDEGRLDILVNNAFALPEDLTEPGSFWEKPLSNWQMVDVGVRSNFVAAWHAATIMVPQRSGLIVAISGYVGVTYTYGVVFGTCKSAADRMARDMAVELKPHGVASVSLWQGLNLTCDIDGDTAHAETYYLFVGRNRDDSNWLAGGRYLDRLERRNGEWRISLRTNVIEWSGTAPSLDIPFADVPDLQLNGAPSRSLADPSYQRPLTNKRQPCVP